MTNSSKISNGVKKFFLTILFLIMFFGAFYSIKAETTTIVDYPKLITGTEKLEPEAGLPQYIKYIFVFSLGIVGIVALLAIIMAAFQYVTSAGNPQKAADAKDKIISALLGMILLLGSYVLLKTINPDLLKLKEELIKNAVKFESPTPTTDICQFYELAWEGTTLEATPEGPTVNIGDQTTLVLKGNKKCEGITFDGVVIELQQAVSNRDQTCFFIRDKCPPPIAGVNLPCIELTIGNFQKTKAGVEFRYTYKFDQYCDPGGRSAICPDKNISKICNFREKTDSTTGRERFFIKDAEIQVKGLSKQKIPTLALYVRDGQYYCVIEDTNGKACPKTTPPYAFVSGCFATQKNCESYCKEKAKEIRGDEIYYCIYSPPPKTCEISTGCRTDVKLPK